VNRPPLFVSVVSPLICVELNPADHNVFKSANKHYYLSFGWEVL
jgi:hypothetical protein